MYWKDEKQGSLYATSGRRLGISGSGAQVENCALNMRSNRKLNKSSPRRQGRQMEQRKKSSECYPAVFPISLSQTGFLARKPGSRQVVQSLLGKVNT